MTGGRFGRDEATRHCEACGDAVSREAYVAVGPTTPAAHQLDIVDRTRDHLVVCDPCFERAAADIASDDGDGMECHGCGATHTEWGKRGESAVCSGSHQGIVARWECGKCGAVVEEDRR